MLKWIISLFTFSLLLGGRINGPVPPCHVVTEVSVSWAEGGTEYRRTYTDQRKMEKLLLYLRSLKPQPPSVTPELLDTPKYQITLRLSDDSQVFFTQYGLSFFSKADGSIQLIDAEKAARLALILEAIPEDFDF